MGAESRELVDVIVNMYSKKFNLMNAEELELKRELNEYCARCTINKIDVDLVLNYTFLINHNKFDNDCNLGVNIGKTYDINNLITSKEYLNMFIKLGIKCVNSGINPIEVYYSFYSIESLVKSPSDITKYGGRFVELFIKSINNNINCKFDLGHYFFAIKSILTNEDRFNLIIDLSIKCVENNVGSFRYNLGIYYELTEIHNLIINESGFSKLIELCIIYIENGGRSLGGFVYSLVKVKHLIINESYFNELIKLGHRCIKYKFNPYLGLLSINHLISSPFDITKCGDKFIELYGKCDVVKPSLIFNDGFGLVGHLIKTFDDVIEYGIKLIELNIKFIEGNLDIRYLNESKLFNSLIISSSDITKHSNELMGEAIKISKTCHISDDNGSHVFGDGTISISYGSNTDSL